MKKLIELVKNDELIEDMNTDDLFSLAEQVVDTCGLMKTAGRSGKSVQAIAADLRNRGLRKLGSDKLNYRLAGAVAYSICNPAEQW